MELVVLTGKHRGRRLTLPMGQVVIGRNQTCEIRLGSRSVSRCHCRLDHTPGRLAVEDLGSHNGTMVNGETIDGQTPLKSGDELAIGTMTFLVAENEVNLKAVLPASQNASDQNIDEWLHDSSGEIPATGDSTILPRTKSPEQRRKLSIGEEGEEIIRRYRESLTQDGADSPADEN